MTALSATDSHARTRAEEASPSTRLNLALVAMMPISFAITVLLIVALRN